MTPRHPLPRRPAVPEPFAALVPLLNAESDAEAAASGADPRDLRQAVWLRLLEHLDGPGAPADPADWLRRAVREEARRARRTAARELPYGGDPAPDARSGPTPGPAPEWAAVQAERHRALRAAVRRTPVRCQRLLSAMLSPNDLSYREIAGRLGVPQGSLGPMRSRCLGCLRRMLTAEAPPPAPREGAGRAGPGGPEARGAPHGLPAAAHPPARREHPAPSPPAGARGGGRRAEPAHRTGGR